MKWALFVVALIVLLLAGWLGVTPLPFGRVGQSVVAAPGTFGAPVVVSVASNPANTCLRLR